jgi:poly(glycerol-phosphate) alpha-glucosyltransferase
MVQFTDSNNQEYTPFEYYYNTDNKPCLKIDYKYNSENISPLHPKNEITYITYYKDNEELFFADDMEMAAYCLNKLTDDESKQYLLVAESGLCFRGITPLTKPNIRRCCVVHSIFLEDAYNLNSPPQPYFKYLCNNHKAFHGIVFLTEWERGDFIQLYGDNKNTYVIPHPYMETVTESDFNKRNPKKAVIVSRLNEVKQIPLAVKIFSMVIKEIPDAVLEIYGVGKDEERIKDSIKNHGVENSVFLKGFTADPGAVFKGAALSMHTSLADGYPLSLIESICNGCPVFAFDIKYGPSDIIQNGETGYLIPRDNTDVFAAKLIHYLKDEELQRRISKNAYNDYERFSREVYIKRWGDFVDDVLQQTTYP